MKKRYMVFALILILLSIFKVNVLTINGCDVIASYKPLSSQDEDMYICKGKEYTTTESTIYYDGTNEIIIKNFNAYYFTNYDSVITLKIFGTNNISLLHLTDRKINITGTGSLIFKENSYVKKTNNGDPVYNYTFSNRMILNSDKKIYEGTLANFERDYETLRIINKLPGNYNIDNYQLIKVNDYDKMTSIPVTSSWITKHINTTLSTEESKGYGIIKYEAEKKVKNNKLEKDNVILISKDQVDSKYTLNVSDLTNADIAEKIDNALKDLDLISMYDLNVYNGKKIVSMKNGHYTIKIKVDNKNLVYEKYQIVYVNDKGNIEEYIDCYLEGDYIVFETTHLSHYAIVGKSKTRDILTTYYIYPKYTSVFSFKDMLKVSLLLLIFIISFFLIMITFVKSDYLGTKKKKRKLKKA